MPSANKPSPSVVFTGTILPPPPDHHENLTHACTEFTAGEAAELVDHLTGLPLLLEHADGEDGEPVLRVGKVVRSWVDPDTGSVRVMASVNEQGDLGDSVRDQIISHELPELSLSHRYEIYFVGDGEAGGKLMLTKSPLEVSSKTSIFFYSKP